MSLLGEGENEQRMAALDVLELAAPDVFSRGGGHGQFYDGGGADVYHPVHADEGHEQPGDDAGGATF